MNSFKLRKEFLGFFQKRGHKIVPSSSLIAEDPTVLFTTAGMQQFKRYFLGETSPYGNKVASCQKCLRTSDIEEVGDETHLTFFEMLGNFSFGAYFKKEAFSLAIEFLTKKINLDQKKIWCAYFKGEGEIGEDKESKEILLNSAIEKEKILGFGKEENFWGPTGKSGPCGPTIEIYYQIREKSCEKGKRCLPNCSCGRFIELWNLVFNQYFQDEKGRLSKLKTFGVDTGMGFERLAMIVQRKESLFETDLFLPLIETIEKNCPFSYQENKRIFRIIADHLKATAFIIAEGIYPSNVEEGYVLRRILRRAIRYLILLQAKKEALFQVIEEVAKIYKRVYPEIFKNQEEILTVVQKEREKFEKILKEGMKKLNTQLKKTKGKIISGKFLFDLYQSYGLPLEFSKELAKEKGFKVDEKGFEKEFLKHKKISQKGIKRKFFEVKDEKILRKLHTATHLLHSALRKLLGKSVRQMGSGFLKDYLRFDFSFPRKVKKEELKKIEDLVNEKIKENLTVKKEEMSLKEALKSGALAFFKEKYPQRVKVYTIFNPKTAEVFSKEICKGPHVKKTKLLGLFKILKEESAGAGIRRIKATLK